MSLPRALAATAAASTAVLAPAHAALAPRTGDWEGAVGGLHASFQLVPYPHGRAYGAAPYAIEDIVYMKPTTCPASRSDPTTASFVAIAESPPPYVLVGRGGTFPFGARTTYGAITGPRAAHLTIRACGTTLRFPLVPASRRAVSDGTWSMSSGGTFSVRTGGRVAYGVPLPRVVAQCPSGTVAGSIMGSVGLFVSPTGEAAATLTGAGGSLRLTMAFTSATTATGTLQASSPGCTATTLPFTARRV